MGTETRCSFGLGGVAPHDGARAHRWQGRLHWPLFLVVLLTIPAFYLELAAVDPQLQRLGRGLYLLVSLSVATYTAWMVRISQSGWGFLKRNWLDILIVLGAAASLAGSYGPWSSIEWFMRLAFVLLVLARITLSLRHLLSPTGILHVLGLGAVLLALAGAGFYWLEPTVHSYGDGLWLAFVSGATVGYGDLVPTTPASRIFAAFMVLLGYAVMSLVTASVAAIFIGEDEQALRREMHRDIKALREEVAALRESLERRAPTSMGSRESCERRKAANENVAGKAGP